MHYTQRGVGARRTEFCLCRAPIISSTKQHPKVTIQTIASLHNIAACDLVVLNKVYTFQGFMCTRILQIVYHPERVLFCRTLVPSPESEASGPHVHREVVRT